MAARYALTVTFLPEWRWFRGAIPVAFHWVLAAYLFLLGRLLLPPRLEGVLPVPEPVPFPTDAEGTAEDS